LIGWEKFFKGRIKLSRQLIKENLPNPQEEILSPPKEEGIGLGTLNNYPLRPPFLNKEPPRNNWLNEFPFRFPNKFLAFPLMGLFFNGNFYLIFNLLFT